MPQTFYFMLKVILCSGILFGYYHLFLRNKVYHAYNRYYLLCAVILSLTMPLVQFDIYNSKDETQLQPIQILEVLNNSDAYIEEVITTGHNQNLEVSDLLLIAYVIVAFVFLFSFVILLFRVFSLINKSEKNSFENIILINSSAKGTPFSFFRYLFWNNQIDINTETGKHIFSHELAHIREKHSLDKIFLNLVLIICWINPFFWLIRKELNMIHEFIADKKAVGQYDTAVLASMIIQTAYPRHNFLITNPFFYSPIKRRLKMLSKYKSTRATYLTRIFALPVLFMLVAAFTFKVRDTLHPKIDREYVVVIDAGHGGQDVGATSVDGTQEKNMNLTLAKMVKALNTNKNIKIVLTRESDIYQSPKEKAAIASSITPDLFISIHVASSPRNQNDVSSGMEVFVSRDIFQNSVSSKTLASALIGAFNKNYQLNINQNPIQRPVGIWVLQQSKCPAVLIEAGYISHKIDRAYLKSQTGQETFAKNVLTAIQNYLAQPLAPKKPDMPKAAANVLGLTNEQVNLTNGNGDTIPAVAKAMLGLKGGEGETIIENVDMIVKTEGEENDFEHSLIIINGKQYDSKFLQNKRITAKRAIVYERNNKKMQSLYGKTAINGVVIFENAVIHTLPDGKFDVALEKANSNVHIDASQRLNEKHVNLNTLKETSTTSSIELNGLLDSINQPLYILDGKIISLPVLKSLDPNAINSINVLKGKLAEAQYGTKAEHGVVVILSKKLKEIEVEGYKISPNLKVKDPEITLSGLGSSRIPMRSLEDIVDVRTSVPGYKIISATIYFVGAGFPNVISSEQRGESLAGNILFKRIKAGTTITFDKIVVEDVQGKRAVLPGKAFTFFEQ